MNDLLVWKIIEKNAFPDEGIKAELIETHISWVILTTHFAYKIKKPIHYSFLDFSTLEKRKYYCEQEVKLNRRLNEEMYLGVVPIFKNEGGVAIEEGLGEIVDYAVKMKRMDNSRQMNLLLEKGEVTALHMQQLADKLAAFHTQAETVKAAPVLKNMQSDFNDILSVKEFVKQKMGKLAAEKIESAVVFSNQFLLSHARRIKERHALGFTLDGHGDLHSKNILLLQEPVIFDCIEFSEHFREGDVLNELAFFCMDLEAYQRPDLASYFMEEYGKHYPCMLNEEDEQIFQYFKLYRANVRLKVNALKAMQANDEMESSIRSALVKKYLTIMDEYLMELSKYTVPAK